MSQQTEEADQRNYYKKFLLSELTTKESPKQEDIDKYIKEIQTLEKFSMDQQRFFCLFSHEKFYPLYISANVEAASGYSRAELNKKGLFFLFRKIHWKQLTSPIKVHAWGARFSKLANYETFDSGVEVYCCGVKLRDKWGKWRTLILKQTPLCATKNNRVLLSFIEAEEITSIYKQDFIWYRATILEDGIPFTRAYFSNGTKKEYNDIVSSRELEILRLAAQQKTNKEISELLAISKNTVERHRKNMIARVGVTDMTALIRICQIVKVI